MNKLKRVPLLLIALTVVIVALATCTACDMFKTEQPDFSKDTLPEIDVTESEPALKSETTVKSSIGNSVVLIRIGDRIASGLIIDNSGTFVTDGAFIKEVVSSTDVISVEKGTQTYTDIKVVKKDSEADLAVLKINDYYGAGLSFSLSSTISDKTSAYLVGYDTDLQLAVEKVFILRENNHAVVIRDNKNREFLKGAVLADAESGKVYGVYTTEGDINGKGDSYKVTSIESQKNNGEDIDLSIPEYQRSTQPCFVNVEGTSWSNCEVDWGTSLTTLMDEYYMKEYTGLENSGHILSGFQIYNEETGETSVTRDPDYKICAHMIITPEWQEINFVTGGGATLDSSYLNKTYYFDSLGVETSVEDGYVWCGFYRDDQLLSTSSDNPLRCNAAIKDASSAVTIEIRTATLEYSSNIGDMAALGVQKQYSETPYYTVSERVTLTASTDRGYGFLGWYEGETLQSQATKYSFRVTTENQHYVAKFNVARLTLESNLPEAGEYYMLEEGRVTFNLNGASGTAPASQTGTLTYPDIPTRDGYVFAGWYDNSACIGEPFDFTAEYNGNIILYAKWIAHEGDGAWYVGNSYENLYLYSQNSSDRKYYAFVPLVSGEIAFYSSNNDIDTYGYLYDSEKDQITYNDDYNGRNFKIMYSLTAGQLYYVSPAGYSDYNGNADIHLEGTSKPSDGGSIGETKVTSIIATVGDVVTVHVDELSGEYTFLGWYNGDMRVSTDTTFNYTIRDMDTTLTATWQCCQIELSSNVTGGGEQYFSGKVTFDLNGASGIAPAAQTGTLTYPDIPTRVGYVFAGWYDNSACNGEPFDFTVNHIGTTTLYAKWIPYDGEGVMMIGCTYENLYVYSRSSSDRKYYAFVPLVSENITIYSTSSWDTYGFLYDGNKEQLTYSDDDGASRNFSITYSVTAGQLYYISPAGWNSSGNLDLHLDGTMKPSGGGNLKEEGTEKSVAHGTSVTICATVNTGYAFLGWYDEYDNLQTSDLIYTYTPSYSESSVRFIAKYEEL